MDISVSVSRLPGPGETILGGQAVAAPGGKGANQAVAAARLGADTTMAGCVGADEFGGPILLALAAEGIEVKGIRRLPGVATGLALITVRADGENMITVAPGTAVQSRTAASPRPADPFPLRVPPWSPPVPVLPPWIPAAPPAMFAPRISQAFRARPR